MELFSLILTLKPQAQMPPEKECPGWWGGAAHQLLKSVVGQARPDILADWEQKQDLRPFTASNLYGHFPQKRLKMEGAYTLRLTGLSSALSGILEQASRAGPLAPGQVVELDFLPFKVESVVTESTDYQELASAALFGESTPGRYVSFEFSSPVVFAITARPRDGFEEIHHQLPFPKPDYVFGSLLERWNAFSPRAFPEELNRYVAHNLVISQFSLRSRTVLVSGGILTGATGSISFKTLHYDRYWMSLLHALAEFGLYAGVGLKTTMGLGHCRRVKKERKAKTEAEVR